MVTKGMNMDRKKKLATLMVALSSLASASPMSPPARTVIPSTVRQIISVDYRTAKRFDTAITLRAQALPDNLKAFEIALNTVGVNPDRDVDSFTFASFDEGKQKLGVLGVASGAFSSMTVLTQIGLRKIKPVKYHDLDLYPTSKGMTVALLDDHAILLGGDSAVKMALNVREGLIPGVDSNEEISKMIRSVEKSTVWSVLDRAGTQQMLFAALGDASKLPAVADVKDQILGSHYTMNFRDGVKLNVDVVTYDTSAAAKLSSLLKLGVLYKKVMANPAQRSALDNVKVTSNRVSEDSDRLDLRVHFGVDQQEFQSLLAAHCFTALSSERKELSGITLGELVDGPNPSGDSSSSPQ
jgi:hypothetical protein